MKALLDAAAVARPGVELTVLSQSDELVLGGGGEVLRLPLTTAAAERAAVLVRALPALRPLLPVTVAPPRFVGVLADGETPFTAELRLPGRPPQTVEGIARGQLDGLVAALLAVPARQAQQWGVAGDGVLLHGALGPGALLADPVTGLLTGVVGWRPRLGPADEALEPALRPPG